MHMDGKVVVSQFVDGTGYESRQSSKTDAFRFLPSHAILIVHIFKPSMTSIE